MGADDGRRYWSFSLVRSERLCARDDLCKILAADAKQAPMKTVAILLFEAVELLDFAGPAEVFIVAAEGKAFSRRHGWRNPPSLSRPWAV